MKIAIIGSGISGLGAAYLLSQQHDIKVFEKEDRIGGHSHTVDVNYGGKVIPVDTGFIVYNSHNYPHLTALFDHLSVPTQPSNMSFAFSESETSLEWAGDSLDSIFTFRRNAMNPPFLLMLANILRFNMVSSADLKSGRLRDISLGEYLEQRRFSASFQNQYLLPMGAAIWSTSPGQMLKFPAASFVQFFANHRLINGKSERPIWRTVAGGSREYIQRLTASFTDRVSTNSQIEKVRRDVNGVTIMHSNGSKERFDQVVFACHSDEALALLERPTVEEKSLLGSIRYTPNTVYLHKDETLMPKRRKAWSSWNYMSSRSTTQDAGGASVTYWMNRLQSIDQNRPLFISLNPTLLPSEEKTFRTFTYMHPLFDGPALAAQQHLGALQGENRSWFCGAYFGHGFHEDGLRSGIHVANALGCAAPWTKAKASDVPHYRIAAE